MRSVLLPTLLVALTALSSCATTTQAAEVKPSGFLGDYSKFEKGKDDEALLVYRNPNANWSKYTKIIIDPIEIWYTKDSELSKAPKEDLEALASYLHAALVKEVGMEYAIVSTAGPDTIRLKAAITEAMAPSATLNTISTVIPQLRMLSSITSLFTGTHFWVGEASAEGELVDSTTGTRLFAGVDRRLGGKTFSGMTDAWSDVKEAFDYWAKRVRKRLATERSRK